MSKLNNVAEVKLDYSVANIQRYCDKLMDSFTVSRAIGKQLTEKDIIDLAIFIRNRVDTFLSLTSVVGSFAHMRHRSISYHEMRDNILRVVSNAKTMLRTKAPVIAWTHAADDLWVPAVITAVQGDEQGVNPYYHLTVKALAGEMASEVFTYTTSRKRISRMSRIMGFSSGRNGAPGKKLSNPIQLLDLRVMLKIVKGSKAGSIKVSEEGYHSPFYTYNTKILNNRDHTRSTRLCPQKLRIPCHQCGMGKDRCENAVRNKTEVDLSVRQIAK